MMTVKLDFAALLAMMLASTGCGSSLNSEDAIRAVNRAWEKRSETSTKVERVVMVEAWETPDTVLHIRVGKPGSRPVVDTELPLRKVPGDSQGQLTSVGCPGLSADGLNPDGSLGDYTDSYVCIDPQSTVEKVQLSVSVSWGKREAGRSMPGGDIDESLSVPFGKPSTHNLPGGYAAWVSFHDPDMSSNLRLQATVGDGVVAQGNGGVRPPRLNRDR